MPLLTQTRLNLQFPGTPLKNILIERAKGRLGSSKRGLAQFPPEAVGPAQDTPGGVGPFSLTHEGARHHGV